MSFINIEKDEDTDVPIRVLCLHGKGESGGSFCYNTEFLDDFEDGALEVSWEYVNAPHSTPYDALAFEWWKLPPGERSFTATTYEGADVSLAHIERIWRESGPFDGIMGFSQGAMLAAVVAAKSLMEPDFGARPKFAILFGAAYPLPFDPLLKSLKASKDTKTIPTMHVFGEKDNVNPPELGQLLADCFADPCIVWHPGAHTVPSESELVVRLHNFCIDHSGRVPQDTTPPEDGIGPEGE